MAVASGASGASGASAETLTEALAKAYRSNPTLTGARARQRGQDEEVPLTKADGRPSASLSGSYSENFWRSSIITTPGRSLSGQGSVNVPLYSGGAVRNAIKAAKLRVEAGQQDLRGTEASVFSSVVAAYMDVIRDSQIVLFNARNVSALETNLRASRDRFEVGDLTRTDVAQSDSRLALARAQFQRAQAQLIGSKENYTALVGSPPIDLQQPQPLPQLPDTPETAVSVALAHNPDIHASLIARNAARFDVRSARGQIAPRLSAFVDSSYADFLNSEVPGVLAGASHSAAAGASLTLPLYQGGRPGASERQAVARESSAIEQTLEIERGVIAQVRGAYAAWQASLLNIESTNKAVSAAKLSLEGVRAENSVGSRTVLDILNAEQEVLNAQVQFVTARRDAYVAAFTLLAAMGHAQARDLNLGIDPADLYDPAANYRRVKDKLMDFDYDPAPEPVASSTASTPSQNAEPEVIPEQ